MIFDVRNQNEVKMNLKKENLLRGEFQQHVMCIVT